jgi:hypothetical protein
MSIEKFISRNKLIYVKEGGIEGNCTEKSIVHIKCQQLSSNGTQLNE